MRPERLDPTVNPFAIRLLTPPPAKPKSKSRQAVLDKLSQPALLTDRIQPLRRPTLRLKKPDVRRTNEQLLAQVKQ